MGGVTKDRVLLHARVCERQRGAVAYAAKGSDCAPASAFGKGAPDFRAGTVPEGVSDAGALSFVISLGIKENEQKIILLAEPHLSDLAQKTRFLLIE